MTETFLGNIKGPKGDNGDVDSSLSTSSSNPVQNKAISTALNGKSDKGHNHDDRYYTESEIDTKLSSKAGTNVATSSANGLLSSADKAKLDGISAGANKTTIDDNLSTTSTNPVQNKVVKSALDNKAGTSVATTNANGLMSKEDKAKLSSMDILHFKVTYENGTTVTFPLYYQGGA